MLNVLSPRVNYRSMGKGNFFFAAMLAMSASGALCGCAVYNKCGLSGCTGDAAITANVREVLDAHAEFGPPGSLGVQTLDHVVYLGGLVNTDTNREFAQSLAMQAPDVKRVINSIGILNGGR